MIIGRIRRIFSKSIYWKRLLWLIRRNLSTHESVMKSTSRPALTCCSASNSLVLAALSSRWNYSAKQIRWLVDPDPCILFLCAGEKNSIMELHMARQGNPEFVESVSKSNSLRCSTPSSDRRALGSWFPPKACLHRSKRSTKTSSGLSEYFCGKQILNLSATHISKCNAHVFSSK
jgi:hypothetical protein